MADSPAGWHADPYGTHELRYFDGSAWTEHVSDRGQAGTAPAAYAAAPTSAPTAPASPTGPATAPWGTPAASSPVGYPPPTPAPTGFALAAATTAPARSGPALMGYAVPARVAVFVGGGLLALGSFLPWVKASVVGITFEKNGIDGDGVFTLLLGVAAVLLFSLVRGTAGRVLTLATAVLAAGVTFYDVVDVKQTADEISSSAGPLSVDASVGIGLWICAIGALVLIIGVMLAFGETMSKKARS